MTFSVLINWCKLTFINTSNSLFENPALSRTLNSRRQNDVYLLNGLHSYGILHR